METNSYSMPGMVYTPVEIGTIRLGHLEERQGRATPVKDDKFRITRLVKRNGEWLTHPLHEALLDKQPPPQEGAAAEKKLREIPIRIMYDAPDLTIRSRYEAFDVERKRPVCASTCAGRARRLSANGSEDVECVGPEQCEFAKSEGVRCKFFGRIVVQIEGQTETDNGFVLRSTSVNTLRNFEAKLRRYWALFGKRLTGVPFRMVLRAKSTAASFWRPFYFVDLELGAGVTLQAAAQLARDHAASNEDAQLDLKAWEDVVRQGLDNGALAASDIEAEMMREFFVEAGQGDDGGDPQPAATHDAARAGALLALDAPLASPSLAGPPPSALTDQSPAAPTPTGEASADPAPEATARSGHGRTQANAESCATANTASTDDTGVATSEASCSTQRPPRPAASAKLPQAPTAARVQRPPVRQNPAHAVANNRQGTQG